MKQSWFEFESTDKEIAKNTFIIKTDMSLSEKGDPLWPTEDVFVISIREERKRHFQERMKPIVPLVRNWSGVDGRQLKLATLRREGLLAKKAHMTRGEVGCFFSHRRIWQRVVDEQILHALVMEDDATWAMDYKEARALVAQKLAHLNQSHPNWDILLLARSPNLHENQDTVAPGLVKTGPFWGLFAYVVSSRGARKLMNDNGVKMPCKPVDCVVSNMAVAGTLEVFALSTEACSYRKELDSDTSGIR
jgi:GR25 family glycosyltransferase involved in LPS biosynthesis